MSATNPKKSPVTTPKPTFSFKQLKVEPGKSGSTSYLLCDGVTLCEYQAWAFSCCGLASMYGFHNHSYNWQGPNNYALLEKHHEALFEFLKTAKAPNDTWCPQEFFLCLAANQLAYLPTMLKHPCVKEVDHFLNKAHGPYKLHLFRISIQKDFPK
jgi:hypothetical protein